MEDSSTSPGPGARDLMPSINLNIMHRETVEVDRARSKPLNEFNVSDLAPMRFPLKSVSMAKVIIIHDDTHFIYLKSVNVQTKMDKYPLSVLENHIGQVLLQSGVESIQCR